MAKSNVAQLFDEKADLAELPELSRAKVIPRGVPAKSEFFTYVTQLASGNDPETLLAGTDLIMRADQCRGVGKEQFERHDWMKRRMELAAVIARAFEMIEPDEQLGPIDALDIYAACDNLMPHAAVPKKGERAPSGLTRVLHDVALPANILLSKSPALAEMKGEARAWMKEIRDGLFPAIRVGRYDF